MGYGTGIGENAAVSQELEQRLAAAREVQVVVEAAA